MTEDDLSNRVFLAPMVQNSSLVEGSILLLGASSTLDRFVTENLQNKNYDDKKLYPFDGYAVRVDAVIKDRQDFGMCIEH